MNIITGDLIKLAKEGRFDVIFHGCNCFCEMGAGIAAQIARAFPDAYLMDLATAKGSALKLGGISMTFQKCAAPLVVVNAYTQFARGPHFDIHALHDCLVAIRGLFFGKRIGYPKIGAGIAGGKWSEISALINHELVGEDHTLVVLPE